jgi:peptide deformylase
LDSPTNPVEDFSTVKDDAYKMVEIMIDNDGIGLAANQVGLDKSLFVMGSADDGFLAIVNPEIKKVSNEKVNISEGCLSFPDLYISVSRPKEIVTKFIDLEGHEQDNIKFEGMAARIFLHEYDHLQGITFNNRVSTIKLKMAKNKRKKFLKRAKKDGTE